MGWWKSSFRSQPPVSSLSAFQRWLLNLSPVTWNAQLSVSLSRFSLYVFHGISAPVPDLRRWSPPRPLLLVACRGVNIINSISAEEVSAALRLGRVRCFGRENEEVFSCGMYEDCIDTTEDAGQCNAEAVREEEERRRNEDFSVKCQMRLTRSTTSQRQLYLQLSIAPIRISWDEVCFLPRYISFKPLNTIRKPTPKGTVSCLIRRIPSSLRASSASNPMRCCLCTRQCPATLAPRRCS